MFTNLNTDPNEKPRLLGELGDLSHGVSSSEFKYSQGTEIFGQAEPADYVYQVIDGAVRSHKLLSDGRRQIGAFHLPGDIFDLSPSQFDCLAPPLPHALIAKLFRRIRTGFYAHDPEAP